MNTTSDKMIGKTDFDFFPKKEADKCFKDDKKVMETGKPIINEMEKLTDGSGVERWVSVTKIPRFDKNDKIILIQFK